MRVVFQIHRAAAVRAMKLGCETAALMQFIAGIVEQRDIPAHIHVPVGIVPALRDGLPQTRRLQRENALESDVWRLQPYFVMTLPVVALIYA